MTERPILKIFLLFLFLSLIRSLALGQEAGILSIIDPGELYSGFRFSEDDKQLVIDKLGNAKLEQILASCTEENWPAGIATLDGRTGRREQMMRYSISLVMNIGDKDIIEIDPGKNTHMPVDMQSTRPFYFVIGSNGVGTPGSVVQTNTGSEDDYAVVDNEFPQVVIKSPEMIEYLYEFDVDEAYDIMDQIGDDGYDFVVENMGMNVYPPALKTESQRIQMSEDIKRYNAYLIAETGDISIIEITHDENLQMPASLIPDNIMYLVIRSEGIELY